MLFYNWKIGFLLSLIYLVKIENGEMVCNIRELLRYVMLWFD